MTELDDLTENLELVVEKINRLESFLKGVTIGMTVLFIVLLIVLLKIVLVV